MPRVLILDIEGSHVMLLPATTGRGGLQVEAVRSWDDDKLLTLTTAEAQGKALRDRLNGFGIAPAPLVIGIGRERLVLKEIKYPAVPTHEEPAVVRFQALKELTDAGDDIVIDYQPRGDGVAEKRALVVAIKKELLRALQLFAQGAGLKIQAVVPRAYGIVAAARSSSVQPDPTVAIAAMTVGPQGGEFLVARGEQLLFSRAIGAPVLTSDASLLGEVRRNLAVYNGQFANWPVRALYLAEGTAPAGASAKLRETLAVPVHPLHPLADLGQPDAVAGESATAAGLARLLQANTELPINFAKPREPKPPVDPNRRPILIAAGVFAAIVLLLVGLGYWQVSSKDRMLANLIAERSSLDSQLSGLDPDKRRAKALDDWLSTEVVWLDEFYDLTARFPDITKLRLVQLNADPVPAAGRNKYVGRVQLKGLSTADSKPLEQLMRELVAEGTYRVEPKSQSGNTLGIDRRNFPQQFTLRFDVERKPPEKFTRTLNAEAPPKKNEGNGGFNFFNMMGGQ
ncbi:MAG: type IV pilus biogenesis protein PilM [Gemmataceae bacterium]